MSCLSTRKQDGLISKCKVRKAIIKPEAGKKQDVIENQSINKTTNKDVYENTIISG
jgi:hypothetical protein